MSDRKIYYFTIIFILVFIAIFDALFCFFVCPNFSDHKDDCYAIASFLSIVLLPGILILLLGVCQYILCKNRYKNIYYICMENCNNDYEPI